MKFFHYEPVILIFVLLLGFLASFTPISDLTGELEEPLLIVLLVLIFIEIDFSQVKKAFRDYKFLLTALLINFVWTPILAVILAKLVLAESLDLQIALVMLLIMPCTDWYLVFTDMTGGNVALSSALLPFNLILQLLLFPLILISVFGVRSLGLGFSMDYEFVLSLLVALILAILLKLIIERTHLGGRIDHFLDTYGSKLEFSVISLIAFCIFASEGQEIYRLPEQVFRMFIAMLCFYAINFVLSYTIAKKEHLNTADTISLVFTTTSRNTPLSLSLATLIFTDKPIIALALLIGPLTEIPISLMESFILTKIYE